MAILGVSFISLACVSSETHNLQAVLTRESTHEVIGSTQGWSVGWLVEWRKPSLYANDPRDEEAVYFER